MKIAVIGAGVHGRAFALTCARAGFAVVLEDVMPDKLRRAGEELAGLTAQVELVSTVEDAVRDADVAVDFVPDELESKLEIWSMIDRMAPPRTVLCTPSDVLSVTDLASCTYRAERCVMVRGLGDGLVDGLGDGPVRLLRASWTSDATVGLAERLFAGTGREVRVEADSDLPMLLKNMRSSGL